MQKLEVGKPTRAGAWTLVAVERTLFQPALGARFSYVYVVKEPYAILLARDDGVRFALDAEGEPLPLPRLLAEVPSLEKTLARFSEAG